MNNTTAQALFEKIFSSEGSFWTQICEDYSLKSGDINPIQLKEANELSMKLCKIASDFIKQNS